MTQYIANLRDLFTRYGTCSEFAHIQSLPGSSSSDEQYRTRDKGKGNEEGGKERREKTAGYSIPFALARLGSAWNGVLAER